MTFHSVWLRPSRGDLQFLETIVRDLALRFDTPVFEPHATLIPDMERSAEELQPLVLSLAIGRKPLDIKIDGITATEAYFRSFYAELEKTPPLMNLKRDTIGISGMDDLASFVPHVSLAYGVHETPEKRVEMKRLSDALSGRSLRFDRMVIVSSSSMTPIDQWIVKNEIYLAG
ncbi:haloacid dehalogenase [Ochrobactrum teleogrylli]|uniref:haloacid dehalogenase n=1 Tax=Ochrobactrum teleogrylli TaxID=2479765 RepID=UPI003850F9A0